MPRNSVANLAVQAEELEVLRAIYLDQLSFDNEHASSFTVTIPSTQSETPSFGPSLKLRVHVSLPTGYPATEPPRFTIHCPEWNANVKNSLLSQLHLLHEQHRGSGYLHECLQKMREFVDSCDSGATSSTDIACSDSHVTSLPGDESYSDTELDLSTYVAEEVAWSDFGRNSLPAHEGQNDSASAIDLPTLHVGEPLRDRKSTFLAFLCAVTSETQVRAVLEHLKHDRKTSDATHQIYAYRIRSTGRQNAQILQQDCEDDGEKAAGGRLLHLLEVCSAENVLVIVCRWYGGVHLGSDRFKHINSVAQQLLDKHGYIMRGGKTQRHK